MSKFDLQTPLSYFGCLLLGITGTELYLEDVGSEGPSGAGWGTRGGEGGGWGGVG